MRLLLSALSPPGRRGKLLIFLFHQVLAKSDELLADEPVVSEFEARARWIKQYCNVLCLSVAMERLEQGTLPARAACITFDDGYASNLTLAEPILSSLGLPATVFVTVDAIERGIMWNDIVREGVRFSKDVLDVEDLGLGSYDWSTNSKSTALQHLLNTLKYRPYSDRMALADSIYERCTSKTVPRLMLSEQQIGSYRRDVLDFGAHTVNHPILSSMTPDEAYSEVKDSRDWLHQVVGKRPSAFAYPNGKPGIDYDDDHIRMIESLGFDCALTTKWGFVNGKTPRFELPRIAPWDRTRVRYAARLVRSYAGI